jgi:hypothetical protein
MPACFFPKNPPPTAFDLRESYRYNNRHKTYD